MPTLIRFGSELLRINPAKPTNIEYSTNEGRSWLTRWGQAGFGNFVDLLPFGNEVLAITDKGIAYSSNAGRSWLTRCNHTTYGEFLALQDGGGGQLLAQTSKGLYYSTNAGRSFLRR